ncbi:MxaK protein [Nitrospirillum pindoramense]|uniref:MxaK protein n=1 Tax=Nitrospirillum amazonense TaxID=28077 RepID=A0A560GYD2_9PROT|nr:MxaK protein [Nitrospirillum amazonense]TWB39037.1 mxaK protein [Nitrospirillum amazonense]
MRRAPTILFTGLPVLLVLAVLATAVWARHLAADNRAITGLKANRDLAVAPGAAPAVVLARVEFLIRQDRLTEAQPLVEALDGRADPRIRTDAHYNLANAWLRRGLDLITEGKIDAAGPFVVLARQEYRRALTLAPDDWDAKFNLDVASRLIRDFPAFERTVGDTGQVDRKRLWTDIPGTPRGGP